MYLTRLCERVVDIEEEDCGLEGTLVERWVDGRCESHVEIGFACTSAFQRGELSAKCL